MIALPPRKKPFHHTLPHTKTQNTHFKPPSPSQSIPHRQSRINTAARRSKTTSRTRTYPDESRFDATSAQTQIRGRPRDHSALASQHTSAPTPSTPSRGTQRRSSSSSSSDRGTSTPARRAPIHARSSGIHTPPRSVHKNQTAPHTHRTNKQTMHHSSPLALLLALLFSILLPPTPVSSQAAVVGGPAPPAPTQYPVVVMGPRIQVVAGVTQTVQAPYTQTFAQGAVETWAWGAVREGSVGMGGIGGEVGVVKED